MLLYIKGSGTGGRDKFPSSADEITPLESFVSARFYQRVNFPYTNKHHHLIASSED